MPNIIINMIYLDFSKVFDSIDHAIRLQKLRAHGLCDSLLLWFNCYLSDRFQRVVFENVASDWSPVPSGVPQGSILGPLLFTVFTNTLPEVLSPESNASLYRIVNRVRWLGNAANFKGGCYCSHFWHVIVTVHNFISQLWTHY